MVQSLARCRDCGLPVKLAEGLQWDPGGIILLRGAKPLRLALIDRKTAGSVQAGMEDRFSREACLKAEVEAVRAAAGLDHTGLKSRLPRFGTAKRKALEALEDNVLILGLGRLEVEKFAPGEGGAMLLRRPFVLRVTAAFVTGILEEMDGSAYSPVLEKVGERDFRLVLEATGHGDKGGQRPDNGGRERGAGRTGRAADRCRQCGLPASFTAWRWDELHGSIHAGKGGRRIALLPACVLGALTRLEREGGGSQAGVLEETVRRTVRDSLRNDAEDAYEGGELKSADGAREVIEGMSVRGWGEVTSTRIGDGGWHIEVTNPVDDSLIAGWLRAIYAVAMGREPRVVVGGGPRVRKFELI